MYVIMAVMAMMALNSCEDEDLEKAYDEETSLSSPFLFSEGYQDSIGFGQHLAKKHRLSLAVDAGLLFWGTPKFVLNNDVEIKSSGRNSSITSTLSWLKAWPNLQLRVAYKIF